MNFEAYFNGHNYTLLPTSVETVQVYYRVGEGRSRVVIMLDMRWSTFSVPQFNHIKEQVRGAFENRGYTDIDMLTIVMSNGNDVERELINSEKDVWIINVGLGTLAIYEMAPADFDGLRESMESFVFESLNARRQTNNTTQNNRTILDIIKNKEATFSMVLLNVLVFIGLSIFGSTLDGAYMTRHGALYSSYLITNREYYRLFTCMFMHFGFIHLATNMLSLIVLGGMVEEIAGKIRFLFIYLLSGIVASGVSFFAQLISENGEVSAGASGAIFGLIGALFVIVIKNRGKYKDLTVGRTGFLVAYSLYVGFTSEGVDNAAHIGGLIAGLILCAILYRVPRKKKTDHFNRAV